MRGLLGRDHVGRSCRRKSRGHMLFSNPHPNPQKMMSCATYGYFGSPRGLVSCCKTKERFSDKGEVDCSSQSRPTNLSNSLVEAFLSLVRDCAQFRAISASKPVLRRLPRPFAWGLKIEAKWCCQRGIRCTRKRLKSNGTVLRPNFFTRSAR